VQDSRNSIVFVRNQPLASTTGAGLGSLDEEAEHSISSGSGGGASQEGEQPPPDSIAPPATPTENVDGWGSPVRVLGGGAGERGAGAGRGGYGGGEGKGGAEGAPGGTGGCFTYEFQALTDADCQRVLDSEFGASAHNAPPVEEGMQKVLVSVALTVAAVQASTIPACAAAMHTTAGSPLLLPTAFRTLPTAGPRHQCACRSLSWPARRQTSGAASWPTSRTFSGTSTQHAATLPSASSSGSDTSRSAGGLPAGPPCVN
jgi:hypothetical protein